MEKIFIHYFSGTGSCKFAAEILKEKLSSFNVSLHSVEDCHLKEDISKSLNIFVFPVYCGTVPEIMQAYIRVLPRQNYTPAAIICAFGSSPKTDGFEGAALCIAAKLLKARGFKTVFSQPLPSPRNFTQFIPAMPEEDVKEVYRRTEEKLAGFAKTIAQIKPNAEPPAEAVKKTNLLMRIYAPLTVLYTVIIRRLLGKIYFADNSCTSCRMCEEHCPSRTIEINKYKPLWGWNCQGCQRCINICPVKAINVSIVKLAVFFAVWFIPYMFFFGHLGIWALAFLHIGCLAAALFTADFVFKFFNESKLFAPLFAITFTKKFRRFKTSMHLEKTEQP